MCFLALLAVPSQCPRRSPIGSFAKRIRPDAFWLFGAIANGLFGCALMATGLMGQEPVAGPVDLNKEVLARITRATVLVASHSGDQTSIGSGFFVKCTGDAAHIVTNFHVIAKDRDSLPRPKGGDSTVLPLMSEPFGSPFVLDRSANRPKPRKSVEVVLYRGTNQEQALRAEVSAVSETYDLAVLRVTGGRHLPDPIDISQETNVEQAQAVHSFGFPVTQRDDVGAYPILTVGRATIGGLHRDPNQEVTDIHINGEFKPGNSGGPVVDANGRLVGVAVASVIEKQIGFIIPAARLREMFKGRITVACVFQLGQPAGRACGEMWMFDRSNNIAAQTPVDAWLPGTSEQSHVDEFKLWVRLTDPMLKADSVRAHVAAAAKDPIRSDKPEWARLDGATSIPLRIQDQTAEGVFKLPKNAVRDNPVAFQFSFVNADDKQIYTQPHVLSLNFARPPHVVTEKPRPRTNNQPSVAPVPAPSPNKTAIRGGSAGSDYREASDAGLLVGMEVGLGKWTTNDVIQSIRPIFREGDKETFGKQWGNESKRTIKVSAKPGYAIGALTIKSVILVDGFSVTFMKVSGGKLDPSDCYESEWVGGGGNLPNFKLGGDGRPVIGVVGKTNPQGNVGALGLALKPAESMK